MSEAKDEQEPSMEEILASIRRIISEDTPAEMASEAAAPAVEHESVLELTEMVADEPEPAVGYDPRPAEPAPSPARPSVAPEPAYRMPILMHDDAEMPNAMPLVSDHTAVASIASFSLITAEARRQLPRDQPIGNGAATLEDILSGLLRPMLKDWLDSNLPDLVEVLVRQEVERLARQAK